MSNKKGELIGYKLTIFAGGVPIELVCATGGELQGGFTNGAFYGGFKTSGNVFGQFTCSFETPIKDNILNVLKDVFLGKIDTGGAVHRTYVDNNNTKTMNFGHFVLTSLPTCTISELGGGGTGTIFYSVEFGLNDLINE